MSNYDPITKEDILKNGYLGSIHMPLLISRFIAIRKLTWKERLRILFGKNVLVSETYQADRQNEKQYSIDVEF